jgi:hypothetical protein
MKKILFFLLLVATASPAVRGQNFEIRATNKGNGVIGIELRAVGGIVPSTSNYVTDLVFGLKWEATYNIDLVNSIATNFNIKKSDVRKVKGSYHFQAFFADNTPFLLPASWQQGNWVEVMSVAITRSGSGKGVFEITEKGFDPTTDPNVGIDLVDYTPAITGNASDVVLPVNLLSFLVEARQCTVNLSWLVTNEVKLSYYAVERSEDGLQFTEIKRIAPSAAGASPSYNFIDEGTRPGKHYYRLHMVDGDGRSAYSPIKEVSVGCAGAMAVSVFPTLSNGLVQVQLPGAIETAVVKVFNTLGQVVVTDMSGSRNRTLNLDKLVSGSYTVQIISNGNLTDQVKIVLQK